MGTRSYQQTMVSRAVRAWAYAGQLERRVDQLKSDKLAGWTAAAMLGITLAIVLYQWLVVGASCALLH